MKEARFRKLCISMYPEDIEAADRLVAEIRRRGRTMTRSELIRVAIAQLDVDRVVPEKP